MTEEVIEQTPEKRPPPEYREIVNNDVVKLKRSGYENAPVSDKPFFLVASDGFYLNRDTLIGRAFVKQKYYPEAFPKLGGDQFTWKADSKVPSEILSKAIHFFRRVFEAGKTEAEVILLMNYETREWDIMVPYQKVSYSGVTSAFDPTTVPEGYLIVGSIHSHCDFGAFHSGTDTGDASDMDGVHLTFGEIDKEEFEVAAMVMISGARWDFKPEEVGVFENLTVDAPTEWDDMVYAPDRLKDMTDEVKEIFRKFGKSRDNTSAVVTYTYDYKQPYNQNQRRPVSNLPMGYRGWDVDDAWTEEWWTSYRERMGLDNQYSYGGLEKWRDDLAKKAKLNAPHWEDFLDDNLIDAIIDSPLFTEKDLDDVTANTWKAQDIQFWQTLFLTKLSEATTILNKLGIVVDYRAYSKKKTDETINVEEKIKEYEDSVVTIDGEYELLPDDTKTGIPVTGVSEVNGVSLEDRLKNEGFEVLKVEDDGNGVKTVFIDVAKV